jgi:molybdopterin converting factor small subunit
MGRAKENIISIKIILPTAFVRHTEGQKQLTSEAPNLPALIADIDQNFPALSTQIKDESGKLRRFINVYVNDEDIRFLGGDSYAFQDGDEVMLIPSIAGGTEVSTTAKHYKNVHLRR